VLAAALDCFGRLGIDATTIQDIQRAANCSVGSLYHHFGSKEGIAEELFIDGISRFNEGMLRKLTRCVGAEAAWNAVRGPGVVGGGSARDQGTGRSSTAPEGSNR
jgi:AcrR family transcriptional regulator